MNGGAWPQHLTEVFQQAITCEYASLTAAGAPITAPATPYVGNGTLDISTGLSYPAKAERARRNPKVALLFADPIGVHGTSPVVLVQGHATVRDVDLQHNTDLYIQRSMAKLPQTTRGQPRFLLRRLAYYYARIWIEVTPTRMLWWPTRDLDAAPELWEAPTETQLPRSDPPPSGQRMPGWLDPPRDWRATASRALTTLPLADLTVVDDRGRPLCVPVHAAPLSEDVVELTVGAGAPPLPAGPACLTVHGHDERFTGQENHTLVGKLINDESGTRLRVDRALASWSIRGNRAQAAISFLAKGRRLGPRLQEEARRRNQSVPRINLP